MGGCQSNELCLSEQSEILDKQIETNLLMLKGIELGMLKKASLGAVLKLHRVIDLTESYYRSNQKSRRVVLAKENHMSPADFFTFDKVISKEASLVKTTFDSISKMYKKVYEKWMLSSLTQVKDELYKLEDQYGYEITRIRSTYANMLKTNKFIENAVLEINRGKSLTVEVETFVKGMCSATTYLFNDKENRITYPRAPNRRHTEPKRRSTLRGDEKRTRGNLSKKTDSHRSLRRKFQTKVYYAYEINY